MRKPERRTDVDEHIGVRLFRARKEQRLSQENLASRVGLSYQQVQKYEKGVNRIGASRLYEFAGILGVPMTYFFEGFQSDDNEIHLGTAERDMQDFVGSPEAVELLNSFSQIDNANVRRRMVDLIKSISEYFNEKIVRH